MKLVLNFFQLHLIVNYSCVSQVILVQSRQFFAAKANDSVAEPCVLAILSSAALSPATSLLLALVVQIHLAFKSVFVAEKATEEAIIKTYN